jgi:hypothetical protein
VISNAPLATAPAVATDGVTLLRLELGPEELAAAGVTSTQVATIAADMDASGPAQNGDLEAADATFASAKQTHDALLRIVKSGQATEQQVTDLQAAKTALDAAVAARESVMDDLHDAATASLSTAVQAKLDQLRANGSVKVPTQFRVLSKTSTEWLELRELLAHEDACAELGDDQVPAKAAALAAWRALADVAAAKSNLDSNLSAVQAAWDTATD